MMSIDDFNSLDYFKGLLNQYSINMTAKMISERQQAAIYSSREIKNVCTCYIKGPSNTKIVFQFEQVGPEISVFNQTNS